MTQALAVHVGRGNILIHVTTATPSAFAYYEVQVAEDPAGPYVTYNNSRFYSNIGTLRNIPMETTIYMQIRYVTTSQVKSDWMQVRLGIATRPMVTMMLRSIRGSRIAAGSIFPADFRGDQMIAFRNPQEIVF